MTLTETDLDRAIHEVIVASYEMWGDAEPDEAIAHLHRERAEQLRAVEGGNRD
jgi:hypothetical protein